MLNILDAPTEEDIFEDEIQEKLMSLTGTDIINGIKISATFSEKINGDNYYTYMIDGKSMTFTEAYKMLINNYTVSKNPIIDELYENREK